MRWMIGAVICMLFVFGEAANAQRETITISGVVRLIGAAEAGGSVHVRLESSGSLLQEQDTSNGRFEFNVVSSGWYTVVVRSPQYEAVDVPIVAPSENIVVTLHPKR